LLSETTATSVMHYEYDATSPLTAMTALTRLPVNYSYDNAGRLSTITQDGEVFTYAYDALSRLTNLQCSNQVTTNPNSDATAV
jgi:uncharacterized protein RhaS with RHS repeats